MSKVYDAALQERLIQHLAQPGILQEEVAKKVGYSSAALSRYKNSNYEKGDVQKMERNLIEYFSRLDERRETAAKVLEYGSVQGYVPTRTSEDVYKTIRYCQIEKKLVLIFGDTGVGKTMAAVKFCKDNPSSAVYIESFPSTSSLRGTLRAIADEMKIPSKVPTGDLSRAIRSKLAEGEKTLIIDEAQNLSIPLLNEITRWPDPDRHTGESHIAIALIGNEGLKEKFDNDVDPSRETMRGRVMFRCPCRKSEATMDDIHKLFPALEERGLQKEMELMLAISRGRLGTRSAVMAYNNTVNNRTLNYDNLYSAARSNGAISF